MVGPARFRPMLAAKIAAEDVPGLRYPLLASPKIDGIRVLVHPQLGPVTRTLKPVRNEHARSLLSGLPPGLDGEVVCGAPTHPAVMNRTVRGIMRASGEPRFRFLVFDWFSDRAEPYRDRHARLAELPGSAPDFVRVVEHVYVFGPRALRAFEERQVAAGYEGVVLRDPEAAYKYGRSTAAEQGLLKLKRFEDAEAEVVGVRELFSNANELERDERGYARRSRRRENLVPRGVLGALVCRAPGFAGEFEVGTGFTEEERARLWASRRRLVGRTVRFRYQPSGVVDAPRFPTFAGFRED